MYGYPHVIPTPEETQETCWHGGYQKRYITEINPEQGAWWHFYAHMLPDISKAKNVLGYSPKYTSQQTMRRAVE